MKIGPALLVPYLLAGAACLVDRESDSEHYIDALHAESGGAAAAECAAMEDGQLQADCRVAVAQRLAEEGQQAEAEALCAEVVEGRWRDECWFSVADAAGLTGAEAAAVCQRAGQYASRCSVHTLERSVDALTIPVGHEPTVAATKIRFLIRELRPNMRPEARRVEEDRLLSHAISQRWEDVPFDLALCGAVSEVMCRYAYTVSLAPIQGRAIEVCETAAGSAGGRVTSEATQAAGLSGFTPAGAALAQGVWADICADIAAGRMDPYALDAFMPPSLGQARPPEPAPAPEP